MDVEYVEAFAAQNAEGEERCPEEGPAVLCQVSQHAASGRPRRVAVHANTLHPLPAMLLPGPRRDYRHLPAGPHQRCCLAPHPGVLRVGVVLEEHEDASTSRSLHTHCAPPRPWRPRRDPPGAGPRVTSAELT